VAENDVKGIMKSLKAIKSTARVSERLSPDFRRAKDS